MRITCPPITHACHFGVDMGHDGELMAAPARPSRRSATHIGADSLAFLSLDGMMRAIERQRAPATATPASPARYPIEVAEAQAKLSFEGVLA